MVAFTRLVQAQAKPNVTMETGIRHEIPPLGQGNFDNSCWERESNFPSKVQSLINQPHVSGRSQNEGCMDNTNKISGLT